MAVRIPPGLAKEARISEGDSFALAELVAGVTPENVHAETDWGKT